MNTFKPIEKGAVKTMNYPSPSVLYSIKPYGIGTPYVESLTSYITRLANAHVISPYILLRQIAAQNYSFSINGIDKKAEKIILAFENATKISNIHALSLINLSEIISSNHLLRKRKAWCPHCYNEMIELDGVYEPLLWWIESIKVCPKHMTKLIETCPKCGTYSSFSRCIINIGFCHKCGEWLGEDFKTSDFTKENVEYNWQKYVVNNFICILKEISSSHLKIENNYLINNFKNIALQFPRICDELQIHRANIRNWWKKGIKICFENLLRISYCLGVSVIDLLMTEVNCSNLKVNEQFKEKIRYERLKEKISGVLTDKYKYYFTIEKLESFTNEPFSYMEKVLPEMTKEVIEKLEKNKEDYHFYYIFR